MHILVPCLSGAQKLSAGEQPTTAYPGEPFYQGPLRTAVDKFVLGQVELGLTLEGKYTLKPFLKAVKEYSQSDPGTVCGCGS